MHGEQIGNRIKCLIKKKELSDDNSFFGAFCWARTSDPLINSQNMRLFYIYGIFIFYL
mgnify:CR=1 FL=1